VRRDRWVPTTLVLAALTLFTGCSEQTVGQWERVAMPEPGTREGVLILDFWRWSWVAAMLTGIVVWGLIFWVVWRYRRRHAGEVPLQTRYNLPLEIFYTVVPIIMVMVFFAYTVRNQNELTEDCGETDHSVLAVGQRWSWTFNYLDEAVAEGKNVYEVGTSSYTPTLVVPVDQSVCFELRSADTLHSFWVVGFLYKEDMIPGRDNEFKVHPTRIGTYRGKCAELCGAGHSRMIFDVEVVSEKDYESYLEKQIAADRVSDEPILGNQRNDQQAGLDTEEVDGAEGADGE
jgi:cytochrome c oxidase subunit II